MRVRLLPLRFDRHMTLHHLVQLVDLNSAVAVEVVVAQNFVRVSFRDRGVERALE